MNTSKPGHETTLNRTVTGGCLCGAVRFQIQLPSLWCSHCHCSQCRRYHGAGYVTWVGVESERFQLLGDTQQLAWYASSPEAERGFCRHCGSSLLFRSSHWAGQMHIALGCLDAEIDRQPQVNAYFDTHVAWMPVDESIPCRDASYFQNNP